MEGINRGVSSEEGEGEGEGRWVGTKGRITMPATRIIGIQ